MRKKIIIVGAGGFGREVAWLVERINKVYPEWEMEGFVDDNPSLWGTELNGYNVLGPSGVLKDYKEYYAVCAIGTSKIREKTVSRIRKINPDLKFATLVDPTVQKSDTVSIGEGSVICAGTVITVNIDIGEHVIINLDCTVGHDAVLCDYVTMYPSVNVSGGVKIGAGTEIGTGTQIIQGRSVGQNTVIGAGAVVIDDLPSDCVAVGAPSKPIKYIN